VSGLPGSRRGRAWLALVAAAMLGTALFVYANRGAGARHPLGVALVAGVRNPLKAAGRTLTRELRAEQLSVQYVVCIKNGRAYRGHPVIRCNVNFGDPHVVAYCSVISAGRLVTTQQDPSIPCKPDRAGSKPLLFPSAQ
jgi:hypothetical protein